MTSKRIYDAQGRPVDRHVAIELLKAGINPQRVSDPDELLARIDIERAYSEIANGKKETDL